MKKTILAGAVVAGVLALSFTIHGEEPKYKNLKILPKNITHEQMDSVMHHFSAALGQRCNFCHVRNDSTRVWDFASDANKHKLVAREMMTMTNKINNKYFEEAGDPKKLDTKLMVTCFTCHGGKVEPATVPPPRPPRPEQARPQSGVDSVKAKQ
ncbi:c-type cytochrome [Flaviaesturariibacter aridisoli]|uniref:Photosynthetic reaction center cytochrome c subunit n=1 Tax=Flaviaesturariibacter aridisoli TaxID=2545761 RepID=A0A4R4E616_9BACT|nr:c-type cytochrome [Flaviaesturariibacter aridisoli]TCZ74200.1 c-type cytochrome [Flaviaesturariibacter aridisoli]